MRTQLPSVAFACVALGCGTIPDLDSFPVRAGGMCAHLEDGGPIVRKDPIYPVKARRTRSEGWVVLSGIVGPDGRVQEPTVLDSHPGDLFDQAALSAFSRWRYAGSSEPCEVRTLLRFRVG